MMHETLIKTTYQNLLDCLNNLDEAIRQDCELMHAVVYKLPKFTNDDIKEKITEIYVEKYEGAQALSMALSHLKLHKLDADRSGRIIKRLPGVVLLQHPQPLSMHLLLNQINDLKQEFHALIIKHYPDKNKRFLALKDLTPDLVKLMAIRDVLHTPQPLYSVGFTWKIRKAIKNMNKEDVMAMLKKTKEYYAKRQQLSLYNEVLEEEIAHISSYPASSMFFLERPIRVSPAMNLRYVKDGVPFFLQTPHKKPPVDMVAHSPLWIFNGSPKIHPLKDYTIEHYQPPELPTEPLVLKRLNLYLARP